MDPNTSIPQGENNPPQSSEQIPQSLGTEPITPKETFVPPVQIQDNSDVPSAPVAPQTPTFSAPENHSGIKSSGEDTKKLLELYFLHHFT